VTNKSKKEVNLGSLEFSSDETSEENCCGLLRKLSTYKATWVIVTILVVVLCGALADPEWCHMSVECEKYHLKDQDLQFYSGIISASLASVLTHEMASVMLTNNTAKKAIKVIPNIKESLIPSVLLCVTFAVLIIENMVFVVGDVPWYAHVSKLGRADLDDRPVYSVFYAEWLINVPILIVLAGSIALGRPAFEVAEPLIVTNVYIILAWVAHFIPSAPLRYAVVSLSFLMYFRASWSMCQWVRRWRRRHPKSFLLGRPLLSFVLIVVFGIYGIVYLGRMHGLVSYRGERIFFVTMDFTTKLFASMLLSGIRSSEFQEVLLTLLANKATAFERHESVADGADDQITPMLEK